jgi:UDP:flavonoid glycosyltransferase YjiC (YdhE family)
VKIVTNPYFEDVVSGAGLEMLPIATREEYIQFTQHFHAWHPIHGPRLVMQYAAKMLRPLHELLASQNEPGETVYCAHVIDMASRLVGEKLAAPVASVVFAPCVLWSVHDSPRLKGALLGPGVPHWLKKMQFWMADAILAQSLIGRELNRLRRELGLQPVRRLFSRWLFASELVLGLFPDWFGPPQPDWPANTHLVGFPLWDSRVEAPLPQEVREFLATGPPPIAFSPGSANRAAQSFFAAALEACDRLGQRGILLTKYGDQVPTTLPPNVRHFGFVPLSKLLPRTAALVHHGGIGSCAQAVAAGVPHLVQPMSYDQFDNSRRLMRLGVASEATVKKFSGRIVADAIARLLDSSTVAARCRELAARCNGPAALAAACDALEQLAQSKLAR